VKTSNKPEPERTALGSRKKWNEQVLPCDSEGKLKVTSVVISLDCPLFLKITPFGVLKLIAPVLTVYGERVVGRTRPAEWMSGTRGACPERVIG